MPDPDELQNNLILLKYEFDKAILDGKSFKEVKLIQREIKELERIITHNNHDDMTQYRQSSAE